MISHSSPDIPYLARRDGESKETFAFLPTFYIQSVMSNCIFYAIEVDRGKMEGSKRRHFRPYNNIGAWIRSERLSPETRCEAAAIHSSPLAVF